MDHVFKHEKQKGFPQPKGKAKGKAKAKAAAAVDGPKSDKKQTPCSFFARGHCKFGNDCCCLVNVSRHPCPPSHHAHALLRPGTMPSC